MWNPNRVMNASPFDESVVMNPPGYGHYIDALMCAPNSMAVIMLHLWRRVVSCHACMINRRMVPSTHMILHRPGYHRCRIIPHIKVRLSNTEWHWNEIFAFGKRARCTFIMLANIGIVVWMLIISVGLRAAAYCTIKYPDIESRSRIRDRLREACPKVIQFITVDGMAHKKLIGKIHLALAPTWIYRDTRTRT